MWPLNAILIVVSLSVWVFVGFSLLKRYRYATRLFDMLKTYPFLVLISLALFAIGTYNLLYLIASILLTGIAGLLVCPFLLYHSLRWINDYSYTKFRKLLETVSSEGYAALLFEDYNNDRLVSGKVNVFIRHDVDISLKRIKKMAALEKSMGTKSTYFFRLHAEKYNFEEAVSIIKELSQEGFAIGLHYETLGVAAGDREKAIQILTQDIERVREVAPMLVVAAHGQKGYNNRNIWEDVDKKTLQISSAYDMKYDMYLSDAGGKSLRDKNGNYLFDRIYEAKPGQVVQILIHPDWWS